MKIITGKTEIKGLLNALENEYSGGSYKKFIELVNSNLFIRKIKFPVLEYASEQFFRFIPLNKQINFLDDVISFDEIGSYVIAGKTLQLRSDKAFKGSLAKAIEYIIEGNEWYVCDIIGERVLGNSLLNETEKTIPYLIKLTKHENKWIVRSVGVAAHYAVKKGLAKKYCDEVFQLLLANAGTTNFHTKKGIGWGAKTIAKFHPDIITKYHSSIYDDPQIKQWFKTKIKIGLGYAKLRADKKGTNA